MNCPMCGTPVKVVGKTTQHYEPIETERRRLELEVIQESRYHAGVHDRMPGAEEFCHICKALARLDAVNREGGEANG